MEVELASGSSQAPLGVRIKDGILLVTLKITYNYELRLEINCKTNKIASNDPEALTKYLREHTLYILFTCIHCGSYIDSNQLYFELTRQFIRPISIKKENIILQDDKNNYFIYSDYICNTSMIQIVNNQDVLQLQAPLLPRYKFKNKQALIDKLRLYSTFS
jgi:hypothetical protein